MVNPQYTFESVVPHTGDMVLLDQVDFADDQQLKASVTVRKGAPFVEDKGLPGWVGLELMAQTVGAFAGARARTQGKSVKIGFLVGTRCYQCSHSYFPVGANIEVTVKELIEGENGLFVFECCIQGLGEHSDICANANVNVFQPEDPEQFLQQGL